MIRRMLLSDLDEVCRIEDKTFSHPWSQQDFASSLLKEENVYLVYEEAGHIIGYCGMWGVLDEGQITNVAVKEGHRGRGIGTVLINSLLCAGKNMNLTMFTLEVRESNTAAVKLYEGAGFHSEGIRKNFYQDPAENAVIMWIRDTEETGVPGFN